MLISFSHCRDSPFLTGTHQHSPIVAVVLPCNIQRYRDEIDAHPIASAALDSHSQPPHNSADTDAVCAGTLKSEPEDSKSERGLSFCAECGCYRIDN